MKNGLDPVLVAAAALLVAGGGVGLWTVLEEPTSGSGAVVLPASDAQAEGSTTADDAGAVDHVAPRAAGWVPADARDAVPRIEAARNPPAGERCEDRPNPLDLAKQTAGQVEAAMREASALSDEEEARIGNELEQEAPKAAQFRGKWDLAEDRERWASYVQDLVDHLAHHSQRPGLRYRVHMVRDAAFNAFALPGGVLGVNTGTLEGPNAVRSEAELAAVMAHELAHVERRHPVAAFQYARTVLGTDAEPAVLLARMLNMPLSSEYEHEADARSLEIAMAGQYDPFAACRLWERVVQRQGSALERERPGGLEGVVGGVLQAGEQVLASHPPSHQRCARTRDKAKQLNESATVDRWYIGERNLSAKVIGPKKAF
jgi:hypothetical protein